MVFERVLKGGHVHSTILPTEISISKTCATLGKEIAKGMTKGFVEIFIDRKNKLVGFASSESAVFGYKISKSNTLTGIFAKKLERKVYPAKFEKGIWEIKINKIPDDIPTIKIK